MKGSVEVIPGRACWHVRFTYPGGVGGITVTAWTEAKAHELGRWFLEQRDMPQDELSAAVRRAYPPIQR